MKSNKEINQFLKDCGYSDVILFENPSYASAFMGINQENRAMYDYTKMIEFLMDIDDMSELDAEEFIEYNTVRALPYFGDKAPTIIYGETNGI